MYNEEREEEKNTSKCCLYFNSSHIRFIALIFICSTGFLNAATYSMPASLESVIEKTLNIEPYQFEYLFSISYFPNIVFCFVGGILMDKVFGLRFGAIVFASVALLGEAIVTLGGYQEIFWLMLVGRLLLGTGTESVALAMNCYSVLWFGDKELSFVFGFVQCVGKLGSSLAFLIANLLLKYNQAHVEPSLVLGVTMTPHLMFMVVYLFATIVLGKFSKVYKKTVPRSSSSHQEIRLSQTLSFPLTFWVFTVMVTFCYGGVTAYASCSQQLLAKKYSLDTEAANELSSVFNMVGALISPIPGLFADKVGYCLGVNTLGMLAAIASLIIFVSTSWSPYISIILYAFHFSVLSSCTWNLVGLMVKDYQLATAYGTIMVIQNFLSAITNIVAGYLLGSYGSEATAGLFLCFTVVGLALTIYLLVLDHGRGGLLNMSAAKKEMYWKTIDLTESTRL